MFPSCKSKPAESRVWGFIELTLKNSRLHSKASESFSSNSMPSFAFNSSWWSLSLSTIFIDFICSYFHGFEKGREIKKKSINKSSQKSEIPVLCRMVWIHSLVIGEAPSSTCAHPQLVWISWRMLLFSFNLIFSKFCLFWFQKKTKNNFFWTIK